MCGSCLIYFRSVSESCHTVPPVCFRIFFPRKACKILAVSKIMQDDCKNALSSCTRDPSVVVRARKSRERDELFSRSAV